MCIVEEEEEEEKMRRRSHNAMKYKQNSKQEWKRSGRRVKHSEIEERENEKPRTVMIDCVLR